MYVHHGMVVLSIGVHQCAFRFSFLFEVCVSCLLGCIQATNKKHQNGKVPMVIRSCDREGALKWCQV